MNRDLGSELATARNQLSRALHTGGATAPIRTVIADLEGTIDQQQRARALAAQRRATIEADEAERVIAAKAARRHRKLVADIPDITEFEMTMAAIDKPLPASNQQHLAAVAAVAQAQREATTASAHQTLIDGEVVHLADRIASLEGELSAIRQRRMRGDVRPTDQGDVALLDLDLSGLREMRARAASNAASAHVAAQQAAHHQATAEQTLSAVETAIVVAAVMTHLGKLQEVEDRLLTLLPAAWAGVGAMEAQTLLPHAVELARSADGALLKIADTLVVAETRAGRNAPPMFGPSKELFRRLRELAIRRNEL